MAGSGDRMGRIGAPFFMVDDMRFNYSDLNPDLIMDALDLSGLRLDSGLIELNSYENRVYQFQDEDRRRYVVKFLPSRPLEPDPDPRGARVCHPSRRGGDPGRRAARLRGRDPAGARGLPLCHLAERRWPPVRGG